MPLVQNDVGHGQHRSGGIQVSAHHQNHIVINFNDSHFIRRRVLERIGARALSAHLRKLCDYLVYEVATSGQNHHIKKRVDTVNALIWNYNVFTLDRLAFCLALRTQEGSEAQVCFYIIQLLLLKSNELRNRVMEFVRENSPDHWKQNNWFARKTLLIHFRLRSEYSSLQV